MSFRTVCARSGLRLTLQEIVVSANVDKFYIVMDYIEHDMRSLMESVSACGKGFIIGRHCLMVEN